jgi:multidrug efflux pump subunit AcrB
MKVGGIFSYFTRHRTIANLLLLLMLAAGAAAIPQMRAQFFPDSAVDDINISVSWNGAGSEDIDQGIVQVLEPALLTVDGVSSSSASSREGRASIRLEFAPGTDIDAATEEVQLVLDSTSNLPSDAEDPEIRRGGWSDRVTDVVIAGPVGVDQLARFADEFVIQLFAAGVTQSTISGVAAPSTIIEVPSLNLIRYDITMREIADRIGQEADASPAGDVSSATRVRTGVAKRSADDIAAIVLRQNTDGSSLTVGDVGSVIVEAVDRERGYFVGDNPAIQVRINRTATGDAIGLQQSVEEVALAYQATLPQGVTIKLTNTLAEAITGRLNILVSNGLMGLGLVLALLFLFLNARTAFWVAAGIPAAMMAAIALMYVAGITINMISLFALIITLGIVVDDAIVVGEHADFRARQLGESPVVAAERAAQRMFSPVFSATLTTVIAFFGLVVISGRFGDLISDIPYTVIVVLIASLVECFLILPHHLSKSMDHGRKGAWYDAPSRFVNRGFDWVRERLFRPFMGFVIRARYVVFAGVCAILASQVALVITGDVQWRFFSSPEQGRVTGNVAMLPAATRDDTFEMMREMQRATAELGDEYEVEYGANPVDFVIAEVGGNSGRSIAGADQKEPGQLGSISITLIDADLRPYSSAEFTSALQERIVQHPLAETVSFRSWGQGPGGDSLSVDLFGAETETLKAAADELKSQLTQFPEITALEDSLAYDKQELLLELTPQGQALGLSIDTLGSTLRNRLGGIEAASYPVGTRSGTVRVELPDGELSADFLDRMQIRTGDGAYVALGDVVTVQSRTGFATVQRENGILLVSVTGDLDDGDPARASEVQQIIDDRILPDIKEQFGVDTALSGLSEQEGQFLNDARNGLIMVLSGIYLALAWIFSSWTRPLVVMAIIPFGLVGTIYGHKVLDIPLSMFTVVGLIGMVGIIINDSIVLVTTIQEYAEERGLTPAIIDGAVDRLRPVMLTTLTTVLGLTPLLYEGSSQAQFLKPTVVTLTFGLGFGMILVLLVVPSLMAMQEDVARQVAAAKRALRARRWGVAMPSMLGLVGGAALFALLVAPGLVGMEPLVPFLPEGMLAVGAFVAALAAWLFLVYVIAGLVQGLGRSRA